MQSKAIPLYMFILISFSVKSFSQQKDSAKIVISGYVDAYYAYYTDSLSRPTIGNNKVKINYILFSELRQNCDALCKLGDNYKVMEKISKTV